MAQPLKSVILVEPDSAVRAALSLLLKGRGWAVRAFELGAELGGELETQPPTALISESELPDLSAQRVLELGQGKEVPVIFLGHGEHVQDAVDLIRMGAHDYLEKPFPQARLMALLDALEA
ncbi:MAG: response regulator [Xanthomonadales bacterium]|nr:response regulator [Xanthomonadales bacterium]NIN73812.1 response regulator [Xanthomonadales bacterium]NIP10916.1 response regulator [Xanthomonadales bacterium]NIT07220.1 response regulator [Xanthomonadales bacterium]NIT32696.1 response regulator [Xanthomonadales bacterium]